MAIVRASCYLVIEPDHNYQGKVQAIRIDRVVQTRPLKLGTKQVALKLNVDVDGSLFEQFQPEATVTVKDRRLVIEPEVTVALAEADDQPVKADGSDTPADG